MQWVYSPSLASTPPRLVMARAITIDSLRESAKLMLEATSNFRVHFVDTVFATLSIDEKERLYRKRGVVDEKSVERLRAQTEATLASRVAEAAEVARREAKAEAVACAAAAAKAREEASAAAASEAASAEEAEAAAEALAGPPASTDKFGWDPSSGQLVEVDPLLGIFLTQVGNRRLFMMDVPTLGVMPVWEKQRVYRGARARRIADGLLAKKQRRFERDGHNEPIQLPGVIAMYEKGWVEEGGGDLGMRWRYGIIDGQHRVGAVRILHKAGHYDGRVLVEVFRLNSEAEIAELFTDINKVCGVCVGGG